MLKDSCTKRRDKNAAIPANTLSGKSMLASSKAIDNLQTGEVKFQNNKFKQTSDQECIQPRNVNKQLMKDPLFCFIPATVMKGSAKTISSPHKMVTR